MMPQGIKVKKLFVFAELLEVRSTEQSVWHRKKKEQHRGGKEFGPGKSFR